MAKRSIFKTYTVTIVIGNSDNKLMQVEWSDFVKEVQLLVTKVAEEIHFFGAPPGYGVRQNACFVCEVPIPKVDSLVASLVEIRQRWRQESVAILAGEGLLI